MSGVWLSWTSVSEHCRILSVGYLLVTLDVFHKHGCIKMNDKKDNVAQMPVTFQSMIFQMRQDGFVVARSVPCLFEMYKRVSRDER